MQHPKSCNNGRPIPTDVHRLRQKLPEEGPDETDDSSKETRMSRPNHLDSTGIRLDGTRICGLGLRDFSGQPYHDFKVGRAPWNWNFGSHQRFSCLLCRIHIVTMISRTRNTLPKNSRLARRGWWLLVRTFSRLHHWRCRWLRNTVLDTVTEPGDSLPAHRTSRDDTLRGGAYIISDGNKTTTYKADFDIARDGGGSIADLEEPRGDNRFDKGCCSILVYHLTKEVATSQYEWKLCNILHYTKILVLKGIDH